MTTDSIWEDHSVVTNDSGYALSIVDKMGNYLYVNRGWLAFNEDAFPGESPIGHCYIEIIPESKLDEVIRTGIPRFGYYTRDDIKKVFWVAYIPIFEKNAVSKIVIFSVPGKGVLVRPQKRDKNNLQLRYTIDSIVGESVSCKRLRREIKQFAGVSAPVVIEGETGTGKELVAQALHSESDRNGPFIALNCAAIPENLFEAELFGYMEGSFTGARRGGSIGKLEAAQDGTLFLDEVNHLPLSLQVKLLRVIQERQITRIGGIHPIPFNARIVCATNQPLLELVNQGKFREDLYYRLKVLSIQIPPLHERMEDIPLLAGRFVRQYSEIYGMVPPKLDDTAIELLRNHSWPGNIRELQNAVERILICSETDETGMLAAADLMTVIEEKKRQKKYDTVREKMTPLETEGRITIRKLREVFASEEKKLILQALSEHDGNKTLAAQQLGISRTLLYNKLKEYQIEER